MAKVLSFLYLSIIICLSHCHFKETTVKVKEIERKTGREQDRKKGG